MSVSQEGLTDEASALTASTGPVQRHPAAAHSQQRPASQEAAPRHFLSRTEPEERGSSMQIQESGWAVYPSSLEPWAEEEPCLRAPDRCMMGRSAEARGCPSPGWCYRNPKHKAKGQLSSIMDMLCRLFSHFRADTTKLVKRTSKILLLETESST